MSHFGQEGHPRPQIPGVEVQADSRQLPLTEGVQLTPRRLDQLGDLTVGMGGRSLVQEARGHRGESRFLDGILILAHQKKRAQRQQWDPAAVVEKKPHPVVQR